MNNKQPKKKKCRYCGTFFIPYKSTIKNCNDLTCIKAFIEENQAKIKRKTIQYKKEAKKALEWELKTISKCISEVKPVFQKYIRKRDEGLLCISCKSNSKLVDGGHYRKAEIYSGVIFDENNCHSQCQKCNRYLGGNEAEYRNGLVDRYGEQFVIDLEEKARITKNYKYSKDELLGIKKKYQEMYNDLNNK